MSCKGVICLLDSHVRAQLRSGVAITSPAQCVEELLLNALDAGATCVAVRVDFSCFKVQVVDNGKGISAVDLEVLGERYFTSKCHTVEDLNSLHYFGYRGEAIASIRETSKVLEIVSRTKNSSKTYCKIFHHGKPKPVAESNIPRPSVGTTITVHYLFYNLPVRQKALKETLEIEAIKQRVEGFALIEPGVSISMRNDETGQVLLQTQKCQNVLMTFTHLFGSEKSRSLVEVTGSKDQFSISGYIGKESHARKNIQFVYVNGRLVLKTKIHKLVSEALAKSIIMKKKSNVNDSPAGAQGSPTKQGQRYPMFILDVKCPLSEYDITFEPAKTLIEFKNWDVLTTLVSGTLDNFLRKENLFLGLKGTLLDEEGHDIEVTEGIEENEADDVQDIAADNSFVKEVLSDSIYGSVSEANNDDSDNKTKIDEKQVEKVHASSGESESDRLVDTYTSEVKKRPSIRNADEENINAKDDDDNVQTFGADMNQQRAEAETDFQRNISSFDTRHGLCSRTVKRLNKKRSSDKSEEKVAAGLSSSERSNENRDDEKDRENKTSEYSQDILTHRCQDIFENIESSSRELPEAIATDADLPDKMSLKHATEASPDTIEAGGDDHLFRADTSTMLDSGPKEQGNSNISRQKNVIIPKKHAREEQSDSVKTLGNSLFAVTSNMRTKLKFEQTKTESEPKKRRKSTYRRGLAQFRRHPKSVRNHTKQRPCVDESLNTDQSERVLRNKLHLKEKRVSNSEGMESRLSLFRKPQGVIGSQKKDKKKNNNDEHLPDRDHSFTSCTNQSSFTSHKNQSDLQQMHHADLKITVSVTSAEESPIVTGLKLYRKSIQTQNVPVRKRSSSLLQVLADQTQSSKKVQKLTKEDATAHTSTSRREDKQRNVNENISIEKMQCHNIASAESSKITLIDSGSHVFGNTVCEGELAPNHNTVIYSTDHDDVCDIMTKTRQLLPENMVPHSRVHTKESRKCLGEPSSELPSASSKLGKLMRQRQGLENVKLNSKGRNAVAVVSRSDKHLKPPPHTSDNAQTEMAIKDSTNMFDHEIDVSESLSSCVYGDKDSYVYSKYSENSIQLLHKSDSVYKFFHPGKPGNPRDHSQRSKEIDEKKGDFCGTDTYDQPIPFSVDSQSSDRSDSEILPFVLYPTPDIVCSDIHMRSDFSSRNTENVTDACTRPYFSSRDTENTTCRRKAHTKPHSSSSNTDAVSTDTHIRSSVPSPNTVSTDACKRLYLSSSDIEIASTDAHVESFLSSLNTETVSAGAHIRPNTDIVSKYAHIRPCCSSFNADSIRMDAPNTVRLNSTAANSDLLYTGAPLSLPSSSANTETLSTCAEMRLDPSSAPMKLVSSSSSMETYATCLRSDNSFARNDLILNRNPFMMVGNRYFDSVSSTPDSEPEGPCSDRAIYLFQHLPSPSCNDSITNNQVKMTLGSSDSVFQENIDSHVSSYYPSVTGSESSLVTTQKVLSLSHKTTDNKDSVGFKSNECLQLTSKTCSSLVYKGVGRDCDISCSGSAKKDDFPKQICSVSSVAQHHTADGSNDGIFAHGEANYLANQISHDSSVSVHLGEYFPETEEYIPSSEGFKIPSSPCCDTWEKSLEQMPDISPSQGFRPTMDHSFQNCKGNKSPGIESQGFSPTISMSANNSDSETGSMGFSPNIRDQLIEPDENECDQFTSKSKTLTLLDNLSSGSKVLNLEIRSELIEANGKLVKADEIEIVSESNTLTVLNKHSLSTDEIGNSDSLQLKLETSSGAKQNVGTKAEETASIETMTSLNLSQRMKSTDVKASTFQDEQGDALTFEDIFPLNQSENIFEHIKDNKYMTKKSSEMMPESLIDSSDVQTHNEKNISQSPQFSTWNASLEDKIIQLDPGTESSFKINDTDDNDIWKIDCTNVDDLQEKPNELSDCTDGEMYTDTVESLAAESNSSSKRTDDCSIIYQRAYITHEGNENIDIDDEIDEENTWVEVMDPQTGEKLHVNRHTGHAIPESQWKGDKRSVIQERVDSEDWLHCSTKGANNDKPWPSINTKWKRPFSLSTGGQGTKVQNLSTTESVDVQIKWREGAKDIDIDAGNSIESLLKDWENPVFQRPDQDVINVELSTQSNKNLIKTYRNIHPCKFTKDMLSCVKVIGQVDNKFIACLLRTDDKNMSAEPDMMVLVDQHAAHERVRLEALMQEAYTETEDNKQVMTQSEVVPPQPLKLTEEEVRVVMAYRKEFSRIGIELCKDTKTRDTVLIQSIPQCIVEREVSEVKRKRDSVAWDIVEALIKEHVELLQSTRGATGRLPLILHRVLSSQACHDVKNGQDKVHSVQVVETGRQYMTCLECVGCDSSIIKEEDVITIDTNLWKQRALHQKKEGGAIKFGDPLTLEECQVLIDSLCQCDLPFQCAHGRPSMMPLLKLQQLKTKIPQQPLRKPKLYVLHQGKEDQQDLN